MRWSISQLFVVGVAALATLVMVLAVSAGRLDMGPLRVMAGPSYSGISVPPPPDSPFEQLESGDLGQQIELNGDEVSQALATYGIDRNGNLFEVHSPQTELPRLPRPTT